MSNRDLDEFGNPAGMMHTKQCESNAVADRLWPDYACDCPCHVDPYPGTDSIESPEEGDFVSRDGGRTWYEVGQTSRRPIVEVTEGTTAEKLLRAYADDNNFWPMAWLISDHGNEEPFKYHI